MALQVERSGRKDNLFLKLNEVKREAERSRCICADLRRTAAGGSYVRSNCFRTAVLAIGSICIAACDKPDLVFMSAMLLASEIPLFVIWPACSAVRIRNTMCKQHIYAIEDKIHHLQQKVVVSTEATWQDKDTMIEMCEAIQACRLQLIDAISDIPFFPKESVFGL